MLQFYVEVARTAFRRQLIYNWANLAGLLTNIVFGAIFSYVMIALYQVKHLAGGYDLNDALRYVWLVQALVMIVLTFGWYDLMLTIRSGEIVSDLSKPCDFYWYWFSREMGRSVYYLLFRGLPTYLAGMLLFRFGAPLELAFLATLRAEPAGWSNDRHCLSRTFQSRRVLDTRSPRLRYLSHRDRAHFHRQLCSAAIFPNLAAQHRRLAPFQRPDERADPDIPGKTGWRSIAHRIPAPASLAYRNDTHSAFCHRQRDAPRRSAGRLRERRMI